MLSSELEYCLNKAFQKAGDCHHEFMTVEHLLLALLDIRAINEILKSCDSDTLDLRQKLSDYIDTQVPVLPEDNNSEVQPTLGFQRVLQRAVFHVQSSGKKEVTSSNVLVAIFSEKQSQAVYLLNSQDISRLDVINQLSHGMHKLKGSIDSDNEPSSKYEVEHESSALDKYTTNLNEMARQGKIDPLIG